MTISSKKTTGSNGGSKLALKKPIVIPRASDMAVVIINLLESFRLQVLKTYNIGSLFKNNKNL